MKVIFVKDSLPTAMAGDVLEVKSGFARNRLLPYSIALPATEHNLRLAAELQAEAKKRRAKLESDWNTLAEQIKAEKFVITARSTSGGRLYGSVTGSMIAQTIEEQMDITLPKRAVRTRPLRFAGTHSIDLLLYTGIKVNLNIIIEVDVDVDAEQSQVADSTTTAEQSSETSTPSSDSADKDDAG